MKIIHTSDWHLGQEFYTYDRTDEHVAFLEQLQEIVAQEQPDALLVAGDIYHNATPSNGVMRMFNEHLDKIRQACPTMQIIVTAGNHDSSARLEVTRGLWKHLGVHIVGRIAKAEDHVDFDNHLIAIHNTTGEKMGYVVAIPHVFPQNYPILDEDCPREERQQKFFAALGEYVANANKEGLPIVMMAHMAITGSDVTGHDESRGGMDYTDIGDIRVPYDYLALGHIHCPQNIASPNARYCGSPLPVSFDENYEHSVSVVEIEQKGMLPRIRTIKINNPWPVKTLPTEAVDLDDAIQLLTDLPAEQSMYVRLHVRLKDVTPVNALERANNALKEKQARFCTFKWEREKQADESQLPQMDIEKIQTLSPLQVAEHFYHDEYGTPLDDELKEMLAEVLHNLDANRQE